MIDRIMLVKHKSGQLDVVFVSRCPVDQIQHLLDAMTWINENLQSTSTGLQAKSTLHGLWS